MSPVASEQRVFPSTIHLASVCKKYHVLRLYLFGSVLRDDFRDDSDIDVLVEFEPGKTPGLAFFSLQHELSELLGRTVDLNTVEDLPIAFRGDVLRRALVQFEAESVAV